jgi:hypothetical protein
MQKNSKPKNLLSRIKKYAKDENLSKTNEAYESNDPRLIEAALELAEKSKSILGGLYYDFRKPSQGLLRNIKNKVIGKIANIVRNTLERPLLTQQKFNEQSFYLLKLLLEENKKLKQDIEDLKKYVKKTNN